MISSKTYIEAFERMIYLPVSSISVLYLHLFFTDYIKVITTTGTIITKQSISSVEEMLPTELFIRIERSYIVSVSKIKSYNHELVWIAKQELPSAACTGMK